MAHEITFRADGMAEMAYAGAVPWHGHGQVVEPGAPLEEWRRAGGLDWCIHRSPVLYRNGTIHEHHGQDVLYRSDNNQSLSVVSKKYRVVQPENVLEFFRELVDKSGFSVETVGSLRGGRRIWALANTGFEKEVVEADPVKAYLLLATSYDGEMATTAKFTSTRVVCNNTLQFAMNDQSRLEVRVRHDSHFNPDVVKMDLGITASSAFDSFIKRMQVLSEIRMNSDRANAALSALFSRAAVQAKKDADQLRGYKKVMTLFEGTGRGANLDGVKGTAWGLLNAVTQYTDFEVKARSTETRLNSAWFGTGARLKDEMVDILMKLAHEEREKAPLISLA